MLTHWPRGGPLTGLDARAGLCQVAGVVHLLQLAQLLGRAHAHCCRAQGAHGGRGGAGRGKVPGEGAEPAGGRSVGEALAGPGRKEHWSTGVRQGCKCRLGRLVISRVRKLRYLSVGAGRPLGGTCTRDQGLIRTS